MSLVTHIIKARPDAVTVTIQRLYKDNIIDPSKWKQWKHWKLVLIQRPPDHPGKSLPVIQKLSIPQAYLNYHIPLRISEANGYSTLHLRI